jgi:hypothetical protein
MSLEQERSEIAAIIKKVPTESARERLAAELDMLASRHDAAAATSNENERIEARLAQLKRDAEIAAQVSLWSTFSMILTGGVAAAYFGGIIFYLKGLGSPGYAAVEATRNVLVFTLIVAMLGFGGLLIVRPLFSSEEPAKLQERFRLAREIFMVFAGIFGTIIGFYFGTATATAADPPSLGVPSFAEGKVSVSVEGGRAPFEGVFMRTQASGREPMKIEGRTLSYRAAACPAGATIELTDGDNRRATAKVACPSEGQGDNMAAPAKNVSTANDGAGNGT